MGKSFFNGTDAQLYTGSQNFFEKITLTPTAYGLTAAQATAYGTVNTSWRNAFDEASDPATRTQSKVAAKNDARAVVKQMSSDLAKIIDGTSTVTNEQKLDLGLSVRATPSPVPPPGPLSNFKVTLNGDGSLELKWKCNNPTGAQGTMYQVFRRIGPTGEFEYIGGTGAKKFLDATIPQGTSQVTYQMQAVRSTQAGPWTQFNVGFGIAGEPTVTVQSPAKLAA